MLSVMLLSHINLFVFIAADGSPLSIDSLIKISYIYTLYFLSYGLKKYDLLIKMAAFVFIMDCIRIVIYATHF